MQYVIHRSDERGKADHGWLVSYHSFSFANYYDPQKMNFGALRVLNDDEVAGGKGFGEHPHQDMEIISIPLEGALEHRDSMGHKQVIRQGDIQVMSAGTGVVHAEYNHSAIEKVKFLQIWIIPDKLRVQPNYDQQHYEQDAFDGQILPVISKDMPGTMHIHQDAKVSRSLLNPGQPLSYQLKSKDHGVYIFVIEGSLSIGEHMVTRRDAIGIWDTAGIELNSQSRADLVLIEVPMELNL